MVDAPLDPPVKEQVFGLYDRVKLSLDDFKAAFMADVPELEDLIARWDATAGKSSHLTGLGKAIAHSALASRAAFTAPLSLWVS
ncbi:MAG: hypothetical protein REJ23_12485 [Brevundimonas sp.]|nr:hypothetical protein [Brevundimonas sp.]